MLVINLFVLTHLGAGARTGGARPHAALTIGRRTAPGFAPRNTPGTEAQALQIAAALAHARIRCRAAGILKPRSMTT
jgi:hypothetical protein